MVCDRTQKLGKWPKQLPTALWSRPQFLAATRTGVDSYLLRAIQALTSKNRTCHSGLEKRFCMSEVLRNPLIWPLRRRISKIIVKSIFDFDSMVWAPAVALFGHAT